MDSIFFLDTTLAGCKLPPIPLLTLTDSLEGTPELIKAIPGRTRGEFHLYRNYSSERSPSPTIGKQNEEDDP